MGKTFWAETIGAIKDSGHKESDVMFIGSADGKYRLTLPEFKTISQFKYDSGFGGQEIAADLIIYFNDKSYIVRGEYDGSEWWEYNKPLNYSSNDKYKPYETVCNGDMWASVKEMNKPGGKYGY